MNYKPDTEYLRAVDADFHWWLDNKLAQVRSKALEEAAEYVEDMTGRDDLAAAIRSMK